MKLVTFHTPDGRTSPGVLAGDRIADLGDRYPDMISLLADGATGLAYARSAATGAGIDADSVRLLAPVPRPPRLRDCSVFEEHIKGAARFAAMLGMPAFADVPEIWYEHPIYYKGNHLSVIGPGAEIVRPAGVQRLDYELEVAVVIGKAGRDIPVERAHEHIAGFTIYNDVTIRDGGFGEVAGLMGPAKAKDFDGGNVLGPWLVTPDELPDPQALTMSARLNGELMGGGSTADMYHSWAAIVSYASVRETLHPGEVIGSGTVGSGSLIEHRRVLQPGDLVEFEVDGLGVLSNRVVEGE